MSTKDQAVRAVDQFDLCVHSQITTFRNDDASVRIWACGECRVRFYPACSSCVDVGHRGVLHPATPEPATTVPGEAIVHGDSYCRHRKISGDAATGMLGRWACDSCGATFVHEGRAATLLAASKAPAEDPATTEKLRAETP